MRVKGILLTLVILSGVLFALFNWRSVTAPLSVNLLFLSVQIPLGLVLLTAAVALSLIFFVLGLLDRVDQLRQITQLERQLQALGEKLNARRLEEAAGLEDTFNRRHDELDHRLQQGLEGLREVLREGLEASDARAEERISRLEERVLLVRNELAADIAEVEDALRREFQSVTGQSP